jgi:uncharacterized protein YdaU (DUF1376 family)
MEKEMHYYQFNIGDYRRDTQHLTPLEHGIYRLLLDQCYLTEKPIDANALRLLCIRTPEEVETANRLLTEFFVEQEDGTYIHQRCSQEIDRFREKSEKAKASAKKRWDAKAMRTHSEGNANHKPITNNQEPIKNNRSKFFDRFWEAYPKKVGKKKTQEIWKRRKLDDRQELIIRDVENRVLNDGKWKEGFIPNPQTYLNGDRWEDEIEENRRVQSKPFDAAEYVIEQIERDGGF